MTSLVEGVRWSILPESPAPDPLFLGINIATILVGVVASVVIFKKLESIVIDRI
jgi:ABC-type polysaccharide/polyol phosphate export permease